MVDHAATARTASDARLKAMARAYHRFASERPDDDAWTPIDEAERLAMRQAIRRLPHGDGRRIDEILATMEASSCTPR